MASTMARTSCSEALTSGRSGRTPGVSDEVLMQFLRPRIYRSTWAGERQQEAPQQNSLWGLVFTQSGRRDLSLTASMRDRCFIGTYAHQRTALAAIGNCGPAKITANIFGECECSRRIIRAFDADRLPPPSRSRLTSDGA